MGEISSPEVWMKALDLSLSKPSYNGQWYIPAQAFLPWVLQSLWYHRLHPHFLDGSQ